MDLLEQYKQQNPEAFQEKKPVQMTDAYGREYSGMVRLAVRLSGGRIKDTRQANYALLGVTTIIAVIAALLFMRQLTPSNPDTKKVIPNIEPSN